jgi:hypothetical protein
MAFIISRKQYIHTHGRNIPAMSEPPAESTSKYQIIVGGEQQNLRRTTTGKQEHVSYWLEEMHKKSLP